MKHYHSKLISRYQEKEKALTSKPSRSKDGQQTLYEWKNNYVVIAENRSVSIMKNLSYNYNQLY